MSSRAHIQSRRTCCGMGPAAPQLGDEARAQPSPSSAPESCEGAPAAAPAAIVDTSGVVILIPEDDARQAERRSTSAALEATAAHAVCMMRSVVLAGSSRDGCARSQNCDKRTAKHTKLHFVLVLQCNVQQTNCHHVQNVDWVPPLVRMGDTMALRCPMLAWMLCIVVLVGTLQLVAAQSAGLTNLHNGHSMIYHMTQTTGFQPSSGAKTSHQTKRQTSTCLRTCGGTRSTHTAARTSLYILAVPHHKHHTQCHQCQRARLHLYRAPALHAHLERRGRC